VTDDLGALRRDLERVKAERDSHLAAIGQAGRFARTLRADVVRLSGQARGMAAVLGAISRNPDVPEPVRRQALDGLVDDGGALTEDLMLLLRGEDG
jgi:hypothetical protein